MRFIEPSAEQGKGCGEGGRIWDSMIALGDVHVQAHRLVNGLEDHHALLIDLAAGLKLHLNLIESQMLQCIHEGVQARATGANVETVTLTYTKRPHIPLGDRIEKRQYKLFLLIYDIDSVMILFPFLRSGLGLRCPHGRGLGRRLGCSLGRHLGFPQQLADPLLDNLEQATLIPI